MDLFDERFQERQRSTVARVGLAAHRAVGVAPTSFADFARRHADEFSPSNRTGR